MILASNRISFNNQQIVSHFERANDLRVLSEWDNCKKGLIDTWGTKAAAAAALSVMSDTQRLRKLSMITNFL